MDEREILKIERRVSQFEEHLAMENYSPLTILGYVKDLRFFLRYLQTLDVRDLTAVTGDSLYKYQLHVYQEKHKDKSLSLMTQRGRLVAVRSFFHYLLKRGRILTDPASGLELPRVKKRLPRGVMTVREVNKILAQPDVDTPLGLRDKALLEVLYTTGMRNGELRNLTLHDVDLESRELRINDGKGQKDRVVPLGEIAAHYVAQYLDRARPALVGKRPDAAARLFISRRGRPLDPLVVNDRIIRKYVHQAGITKHVTAHGFRHTCATHMLKGRANIRHIQALLGHKSLDTTQMYTHVEVGDLKREHRRTHPREQDRGE